MKKLVNSLVISHMNIYDMIKVSSMRQKLQNSKGYAKSPEFLPALGLYYIFKKKFVSAT